MIKVLLVNEQTLFNEAIQALLSTEADIDVVGALTDGREVMTQIHEKNPNIILVDIHMTSVEGIKLTVHIKDNYPNVKVIFLTNFAKRDFVIAGILAGADGFLLKDIDTENLLQSIRNAYRNQMVISGEAAKILAQKVIELEHDRHKILKDRLALDHIYLSKRELDLALLLADEFTNQELSQTLYLSEGTIKNYVSELYSKLHVNTRREAIHYLRNLTPVYYE